MLPVKNAQPAGEMTGFMRLNEQNIFSPITVTRGKATPPMTAGLGIEVNKEKLQRMAGRLCPHRACGMCMDS